MHIKFRLRLAHSHPSSSPSSPNLLVGGSRLVGILTRTCATLTIEHHIRLSYPYRASVSSLVWGATQKVLVLQGVL